MYAKFRADKEPTPGHSRELFNVNVKPEDYDMITAKKSSPASGEKKCVTILQHFQKHVASNPNTPFLGTRKPASTPEGEVGPYEW